MKVFGVSSSDTGQLFYQQRTPGHYRGRFRSRQLSFRHAASAWADGDFHVLAEGSQEIDQSADRERPGAISHNQGPMRLLYAQRFGGLCLVKPRCLMMR